MPERSGIRPSGDGFLLARNRDPVPQAVEPQAKVLTCRPVSIPYHSLPAMRRKAAGRP